MRGLQRPFVAEALVLQFQLDLMHLAAFRGDLFLQSLLLLIQSCQFNAGRGEGLLSLRHLVCEFFYLFPGSSDIGCTLIEGRRHRLQCRSSVVDVLLDAPFFSFQRKDRHVGFICHFAVLIPERFHCFELARSGTREPFCLGLLLLETFYGGSERIQLVGQYTDFLLQLLSFNVVAFDDFEGPLLFKFKLRNADLDGRHSLLEGFRLFEELLQVDLADLVVCVFHIFQ